MSTKASGLKLWQNCLTLAQLYDLTLNTHYSDDKIRIYDCNYTHLKTYDTVEEVFAFLEGFHGVITNGERKVHNPDYIWERKSSPTMSVTKVEKELSSTLLSDGKERKFLDMYSHSTFLTRVFEKLLKEARFAPRLVPIDFKFNNIEDWEQQLPVNAFLHFTNLDPCASVIERIMELNPKNDKHNDGGKLRIKQVYENFNMDLNLFLAIVIDENAMMTTYTFSETKKRRKIKGIPNQLLEYSYSQSSKKFRLVQ